tara:strand:+ start:230 stop:403 length:174 start_codon:yes stop_codon:yes gene_type:complete
MDLLFGLIVILILIMVFWSDEEKRNPGVPWYHLEIDWKVFFPFLLGFILIIISLIWG